MTIQECVQTVRSRQQKQWMWCCISWGLLAGGVLGCLFGIISFLSLLNVTISWWWTAAAIVICPLVGLAIATIMPRRTQQAAVAIDRNHGLKDGMATALQFLNENQSDAIHQLQIEDTDRRAQLVDPQKVAPYVAPRQWLPGLTLTAVATLMAFLVSKPTPVVANVVPNAVVSSQALRINKSLEELEQFNSEELDPEVEELLKDLAEQIEQLRQPEMDPREALAKLSEMEAALQEQQEKLNRDNAEAALQQVGDALSLSEEMQAAGEAMAQGDMEKAAEEIARLEMPKLDRKTEKSVVEKLDRVESQSSGSAKKNLKEAVQQVSAGLSGGNRSKFKEGMKGLAGQCKKQGRRKKLSDLLRKQCQCLSECKGECECECKSKANCNKPGGKNWGLGASGNQPGDKTSKLGANPKMDIKGQESAQGDVDVETISSEEQEQEAVRQYRQQSEKYEQLSESVLSSEPIPLGHRQTIRRYFEMIRPQAGETDQVIKQTDNN